jgi:hypothetical protein
MGGYLFIFHTQLIISFDIHFISIFTSIHSIPIHLLNFSSPLKSHSISPLSHPPAIVFAIDHLSLKLNVYLHFHFHLISSNHHIFTNSYLHSPIIHLSNHLYSQFSLILSTFSRYTLLFSKSPTIYNIS